MNWALSGFLNTVLCGVRVPLILGNSNQLLIADIAQPVTVQTNQNSCLGPEKPVDQSGFYLGGYPSSASWATEPNQTARSSTTTLAGTAGQFWTSPPNPSRKIEDQMYYSRAGSPSQLSEQTQCGS